MQASCYLILIKANQKIKANPVRLTTLLMSRPPQASEWLYDPLQPQEGEVQERWLLLEEAERREDHPRGSHEAQSAGSRGETRNTNAPATGCCT